MIVGGAVETRPRPASTRSPTGCDGKRFNGVYGARILALSAYGSPRRTSRLAIHGYPPAARSTTESAGCIRVPGAALERLTREAPPGTPVEIRA